MIGRVRGRKERTGNQTIKLRTKRKQRTRTISLLILPYTSDRALCHSISLSPLSCCIRLSPFERSIFQSPTRLNKRCLPRGLQEFLCNVYASFSFLFRYFLATYHPCYQSIQDVWIVENFFPSSWDTGCFRNFP